MELSMTGSSVARAGARKIWSLVKSLAVIQKRRKKSHSQNWSSWFFFIKSFMICLLARRDFEICPEGCVRVWCMGLRVGGNGVERFFSVSSLCLSGPLWLDSSIVILESGKTKKQTNKQITNIIHRSTTILKHPCNTYASFRFFKILRPQTTET